jgi:hypothetical protein
MHELFSQMYEADVNGGRPSIALDQLLRAMLFGPSSASVRSAN